MEEKIVHWAEIWIGYKVRLIDFVGLTSDAMHIHGSLLILFMSAIGLRRRPDSMWCWLTVFVAEILNEFADMRGMAPGEDTMEASVHDLYNTMFWPTVMVILGRWLFPPRVEPMKQFQSDSGNLPNQSLEQPSAV